VAKNLYTETVTKEQYNKIGKYHSSTIERRFEGWIKALKKANLSTKRHNKKLKKDEIIKDLKRVAKKLEKNSLTRFEYNVYGKYSASGITGNLNINWFKALKAAGLKKTRTLNISNEELFKNLETVWIKLGRQPKYREIEKSLSKYSASTYESRFITWRKSLEAFVEYVNNEGLNQNNVELEIAEENYAFESQNDIEFSKHKTKRDINSRLKVQVLIRDGNKCRLCGITVTGDNIHFDHIKPWSKGGETVFENIQVLCAKDNIAKGNYYNGG
jgi:hypothetical protein